MVRRLVLLLFILFCVDTAYSQVLVTKDYWILPSGHQSVFLNSFSGALTRTVVAENSKYGDVFRIDHAEGGSVNSYYRAYDASGNLYYYGRKRSDGSFFDHIPVFKFLPSSIEIGTTYTVSASRDEYGSNGMNLGTGTDDFRITVTGPESVTVPAGTFTAYKIQMVDSWWDKWSYERGTTTLTYWVVKDIGIIKIEKPGQIYELSSSTELTQQLVTEIYVATFGRAPAISGLNYWANAVKTGSFSIEQVAQSFFDQPETKVKFPEGLSNTEFITTIYYNVLNRAPAAEGLAYWVAALDSGVMRRDQAIIAIINGAKSATGSSEDAAMLKRKTEIGVFFANSEIGDLASNENFMDWASGIISFAARDDFNMEEADDYLAEILSPVRTFEDINGTGSEIRTYTELRDAMRSALDQLIALNPKDTGLQSIEIDFGDHFTASGYRVGTEITLSIPRIAEDGGVNELVAGWNSVMLHPAEGRYSVSNSNRFEYAGNKNTWSDQVVSYRLMNEDAYDINPSAPLDGVIVEKLSFMLNGVLYDLSDYLVGIGFVSTPSTLTVRLFNAVNLEAGGNPVEGFSAISFSVGGGSVITDISSVSTNAALDFTTAYAQIVALINAQLAADGLTNVTAELASIEQAFFSIPVAGFNAGEWAGYFYPITIINTGVEELRTGYVNLYQLPYDTDLNYNQMVTPSVVYSFSRE